MNDFIFSIKNTYYTNLLVTAVAIITLFISIKNKRNLDPLLPIYIFAYLIECIDIMLAQIFFGSSYQLAYFSMIQDSIFTIFEFIIFLKIFRNVLIGSRYLKYTTVIATAYISIAIILLFLIIFNFKRLKYDYIDLSYLCQAVSLITSCIFYYLELFRTMRIPRLENDPHFWLITGLCFCLACTLPLSTYIQNFERIHYYNLSSIYNLSYVFLFSMISRAYLCRTKLKLSL